ncbi:MAG: hypothetical protein Q8P67_16815, partial [archaeon]|nr:hypothetical protein [archaeon]
VINEGMIKKEIIINENIGHFAGSEKDSQAAVLAAAYAKRLDLKKMLEKEEQRKRGKKRKTEHTKDSHDQDKKDKQKDEEDTLNKEDTSSWAEAGQDTVALLGDCSECFEWFGWRRYALDLRRRSRRSRC